MMWMTTPSGTKWNLLRPRWEDVNFSDIAHNLSMQVRFNGSLGPYTTAEHSVHVHDEAVLRGWPAEARLLALLHDAHEAYIGDLITPVVSALDTIATATELGAKPGAVNEAVGALKARTDAAIFVAAGLDLSMVPNALRDKLKGIDASAMMTERDALALTSQPEPWGHYEDQPRLDFKPRCWTPASARAAFENRLRALRPRAFETTTGAAA